MSADVKSNLQIINDKIRQVEKKSGRAEGSVKLMAVSKFHPAEDVIAAINEGQLLFGENRVQEAGEKFPAIFEQFYSEDDIKELLLADLKKRQEAGYIHSQDIKQFVRWHKNDIADQLVKK